MTRVVTGAALLGVLQGVLVVLLLTAVGLDQVSTGWFTDPEPGPAFWDSETLTGLGATLGGTGYGGFTGAVALEESTPLPLRVLPLLLAVVTAGAAAAAVRRGWLGAHPAPPAWAAGRTGVAAVLTGVLAVALTPRFARRPERAFADYSPVAPDDGVPWAVLATAVVGAALLVLLVALREQRAGARATWALVVVLAAGAVVQQQAVLEPPGLGVLSLEVLAVLLGGVALLLARPS